MRNGSKRDLLNEENDTINKKHEIYSNKQIPKNDYLSWDISTPIATRLKNKEVEQNPQHLFKSYFKPSEKNQYKNIPLKDVPMNELVKKLQQEFELENDKTEDIDHIWKRYKFNFSRFIIHKYNLRYLFFQG